MKNQLNFHDVCLNVIDRNGEKWLTTADIARALYGTQKGGCQNDIPLYSRVAKLYSRHNEEFTDRMTSLIEVQTTSGIQTVRVFSLRGAHLLGMLARSERAKEFRRWVLDIIEQHQDETGILITQYHQALAALEAGSRTASVAGRELNRWQKDKPNLQHKLRAIAEKLQPSLIKAA
ncbi:BRO family protein [Wielerella bovis]|uniref:BRO family protein n=1 Tax=Wielerella bovis TaxID=2917790 RepID=UPI002019617D|nr:BRO family protein [Wielerella bovis]MCG7657111.1 hypothetical protein [Wielerella bovis]MCG7659334.1 hypothetical protein [Wielerella bovis]ULJ64069.1 hypothetical protein MIS33_07825 [Wielerella bovis]ULJ67467.1 hypothetical protein MIS31_02620 [Wielerella bovis]